MEKLDCRIEEWSGAPHMDTGAPMPAIVVLEAQLYVAYMVSAAELPTEFEERFAVVRFDGVLQHTFGYPNDEALPGHPLYPAGLKYYAFNEVVGSPYLRGLGERNAKTFPGTQEHYIKRRHWIVAFHDETLEVVGDSVTYLGTEDARSARDAIAQHAA
jgi:hypothetical protein